MSAVEKIVWLIESRLRDGNCRSNTCAAVYETGLPALGREPDQTWFSLLEYYGPDFEPSTGTGTVEIWVAIRQ